MPLTFAPRVLALVLLLALALLPLASVDAATAASTGLGISIANEDDATAASANACPAGLSFGRKTQKQLVAKTGRPITIKVYLKNTRKQELRNLNLRVNMPNVMVVTRSKASPRLKPIAQPLVQPVPAAQVVNYYWVNQTLKALGTRIFRLRTWVSDCPHVQGTVSVHAVAYITDPVNGTAICWSSIMPQTVSGGLYTCMRQQRRSRVIHPNHRIWYLEALT